MTDEEIADFISEKVMKWHRGMDNHWYDTNEDRICWARDWHPATDLNQAVQAAEKAAERQQSVLWHLLAWNSPRMWRAVIGQGYYESTIGPALALSLAVVKAAGGQL